MQYRRQFLLKSAAAALSVAGLTRSAKATFHRQYYDVQWYYYPSATYYYTYYYYLPVPTATTYSYHYCIFYPNRPRYIYYYNPVAQTYWGRFDLEATGENRYSLLAKEDRKSEFSAIPESAFPEPGKMPMIPESQDNVRMELPKAPRLS